MAPSEEIAAAPARRSVRIGVITYDTHHLKTEQLAIGLRHLGYDNLTLFALPFVERRSRNILFAHRPEMSDGAHTREIASRLGAGFVECPSAADIPADQVDLFLVAGAGILPAEFVRAAEGRVLNAHPGIIPLVRGLDAFKWAIYDGMPIGNSLHLIDEEADAGEVLAVWRTPLFASDTMANFARRHYETELVMLLDFERILRDRGAAPAEEFAVRPARMRMPEDKQRELDERFEAYKAQFAQ